MDPKHWNTEDEEDWRAGKLADGTPVMSWRGVVSALALAVAGASFLYAGWSLAARLMP